jgi:hypothetical protein
LSCRNLSSFFSENFFRNFFQKFFSENFFRKFFQKIFSENFFRKFFQKIFSGFFLGGGGTILSQRRVMATGTTDPDKGAKYSSVMFDLVYGKDAVRPFQEHLSQEWVPAPDGISRLVLRVFGVVGEGAQGKAAFAYRPGEWHQEDPVAAEKALNTTLRTSIMLAARVLYRTSAPMDPAQLMHDGPKQRFYLDGDVSSDEEDSILFDRAWERLQTFHIAYPNLTISDYLRRTHAKQYEFARTRAARLGRPVALPRFPVKAVVMGTVSTIDTVADTPYEDRVSLLVAVQIGEYFCAKMYDHMAFLLPGKPTSDATTYMRKAISVWFFEAVHNDVDADSDALARVLFDPAATDTILALTHDLDNTLRRFEAICRDCPDWKDHWNQKQRERGHLDRVVGYAVYPFITSLPLPVALQKYMPSS